MSWSIFNRRKTTAVADSLSNVHSDEVFSDQSTTGEGDSLVAPSHASPRRHRMASTSTAAAALSTSYGLPSRSYIHHAGHRGSQDPVRYSSAGVREQTAELSSSFINSSSSEQRSRADSNLSSAAGASPRRHNTIAEAPEPESASHSDDEAPTSSLTEGLRQQRESSVRTGPFSLTEKASRENRAPAPVPELVINDETRQELTETTPLLGHSVPVSQRGHVYDAESNQTNASPDRSGIWNRTGHQYPTLREVPSKLQHIVTDPKAINVRQLARKIILEPIFTVPAVFLGVLLNLLDALSYGLILFPLGEEVFKDMGPDGVSMFYVSCIISQLVYSSGSIFRGGVGSEMIEVVPFFHKMSYMIMGRMGTSNPAALRATVIVSYAMSAMITGAVFLSLGAARLGTLVNFFPHSILTGCIGGVGIFLFTTGIEVSARLDGSLELSTAFISKLFTADTVALWIPPLVLAIILLVLRHYFDRPWLVPAFYIGITALFYIITTAVPSISMTDLRSSGWVFQAPATGVPFYNFYSYYRFDLVDWGAIWITIPSQFALTFFGILHVPINVPNLAMVAQEDNVSINHELILHGVSNTLSGAVGSIQNYLVFANSVLFIETGGNSRLAGYLLAAATFGLWVAGPVVIGFVPVMVVGTLIYQLGIELTLEALWKTYGRLQRLEYATIVVISLVMGLYDFVVGIAIGIGLACLVYVVQTSRKTVIRAEFSGAVAESTVRRNPRQRNYLRKVGPQIRVVKLGGYLFFGSIVKVEKKVRKMVDEESFAASPIRYLVVELTHVTGIDFSAAEAFTRMNRILHRQDVKMAIAGVSLDSDIGMSLSMVGLFDDGDEEDSVQAPKVYEDLNGALEACENEMLKVLTEKQTFASQQQISPPISVPETPQEAPNSPFELRMGTPRQNQLQEAATTTITENPPKSRNWQSLKQPLPLLMNAFQELTDQDESFWFRAVPYFIKREFVPGQMLYRRGDQPDGFYLLQSGILRAEYFLEQGNYHESIVAGTTCGELPFFSETKRTSSVFAERDCVAWLLTPEKWEELQEKDGQIAKELLRVGMKLSAERMHAITSYVLITAS